MTSTVIGDSAAGPSRIGRYELRGLIGIGGFAMVSRAYDPALDADVAIKILEAEVNDSPEIRERFLREAQLLRRVDDTHIVTVYDIGETKDGRPYFVMEYADGGVLEQRVPHRSGNVDAQSLRKVIEALRSALAALHRAGIVHRDVKPANLLIVAKEADQTDQTSVRATMLHDEERVVLGDLGIAKDHGRESPGPTILGGTPNFCAPEQLRRGEEISPAADVYGATGVVWNLLTGTVPPTADGLAVELPSVPAAWRPIIEKGLEPDPAERYVSIEAWADACLDAIGDGAGTTTVGFRAADAATTCPYKGLAAFQPDDAGLFFGREALIDELVARLQLAPALVIGGPSGSGKSSLLRAGLIPAITSGALPGSQRWHVALMTPGNDIMGELAHHLTALGASVPVDATALRQDPNSARRALPLGEPVLIAIDQFEELFTLNSALDQQGALDVLAALSADQHATTRVVLALRADFYDSCAQYAWLADRINENQALVGPMGRAGLRQAIEGPALRVGLRLETGLVDRILDDSGASIGSLPLVGHALMETWLRRRGHLMTLAGYESAGGVAGAIAQRAEQTYGQLPDSRRDRARGLILQLTAPGDGGPDTRRVIRRDEIDDVEASQDVIETFTEARLLTVDDETIQLAHETLLISWPRAKTWIDEARDDLRSRQRLATSAEAWDESSREPDLLLRGTPLDSTLEWSAQQHVGLAQSSETYLEASRLERDRRAAEANVDADRRRKYRRRATFGLVALSLAAVAASVAAFVGLRDARSNEDLATSRFNRGLAAIAEAQAASDPLFALALAAESAERSTEAPAEGLNALVTARTALHNQLQSPVPISVPLAVGDALSIRLTPGAEMLVVGGRGGAVSFWDTTTGTIMAKTDAHTGGVQEVDIDRSGTRMATAASDERLILWDLTQSPPTEQASWSLGSDAWSTSFSPDGSLVAATTEDGRLHLYDTTSLEPVWEPIQTAANRDAITVAFDAKGLTLLVGNGSGELLTVPLDHSGPGPPMQAHGFDLWEIVPSRDGSLLYTVSADGTIQEWDATTNQLMDSPLADVSNAGHGLLGLAITENGDELVIGGSDGRIRRWDTRARRLIAESVAAHEDRVTDGSLSADGTIYASLGDDQKVRLWAIGSRGLESGVSVVTDGPAGYGIALSPDGSEIAVGGADGTVTIRSHEGAEIRRLDAGDGRIFGLVYLDDRTLVTADGPCALNPTSTATPCSNDSGELNVFDTASGDRGATVSTGPILDLALAPDGERIATAGVDGHVATWSTDLAEQQTVADLGTEVHGIVFTVDGKEILTADLSGRVGFWKPEGGTSRDPFVCCDDAVFAIAVDPSGHYFAVADGLEAVFVFSLNDMAPKQRLTPLVGGAHDVGFASNNVVVASSTNGTVVLWHAQTGGQLGPVVKPHDLDATQSAWRLAVDANNHVWSTSEAGSVHRLEVLDLNQACSLSEGMLESARIDEFLGGEEPVSCR